MTNFDHCSKSSPHAKKHPIQTTWPKHSSATIGKAVSDAILHPMTRTLPQGLVNVPMFHITLLKRGYNIQQIFEGDGNKIPKKGHQSQPLYQPAICAKATCYAPRTFSFCADATVICAAHTVLVKRRKIEWMK